MDVDLGLSLAVDDDRYGNILDDMKGLGFSDDPDQVNRLVREVDGLKMPMMSYFVSLDTQKVRVRRFRHFEKSKRRATLDSSTQCRHLKTTFVMRMPMAPYEPPNFYEPMQHKANASKKNLLLPQDSC
jgi:hypothetical protein